MYFISIFFSSFMLWFGLVLIFGIYLFILFNKSDYFDQVLLDFFVSVFTHEHRKTGFN